MNTLFVIYFLIGGIWVQGTEYNGWGGIEYETQEICMEKVIRAEQIQEQLKLTNPMAYDKKFNCIEPPH